MAVGTRRLASRWILALLVPIAFASCGDNGTGLWRFQKVVITPNGFFPGGRGATTRFQVGMVNNLGAPIPTEGFRWTWSSSDPGVIAIDQDGLATAVSNGSAQIRAKNAGFEGIVTVNVNQVPSGFTVVEGDKQSGVVGRQLANQATVKLVDAGGSPIADQPVQFTASGGGVVGTKSAVTGADGIAKTTWTLGTRTSDKQVLTATMAAVTKELTATPLADAPNATAAFGRVQDGWAMEAVDTTLAVVITDKHGNPVPNADVTWRVVSGGGAILASGPKTNAAGRTTAVWTLGTTTGPQTAVAEPTGLPAVDFTATAKPNAIISGTVTVQSGLQSVVAAQARPTPRPAARPAPEYVPGDWIVTFAPDAVGAPAALAQGFGSPAAVAAVEQGIEARIAALDAGTFSVRGVSPRALAARIQVNAGADFEAVGQRLRVQPGVRSVERNRIVRLTDPAPVPAAAPPVTISDALYPLQSWHYEMIGLDQAWKITTGNSAIIVAVVDDGIRATHTDLTANLTTDGYDFVSDVQVQLCNGLMMSNADDGGGPDADPTVPAEYDYNSDLSCVEEAVAIGGHGVHVAGTIGAVAGSTGAVGVSQKVKIRPIRVLGAAGGNDYDIAQGILYAAGLPADNGAGGTVTAPSRSHIINLSLGGPGPASAVLASAVQAASAAGSLLIAAAGNDGGNEPNYPAAFPEVLSVSAVGPTGGIASFSSWGSTVDIAAPGGNGAGGYTHQILSTLWDFGANSETWDYYQGTSMAAPHVSGVAALILAKEPTLTAAQLRQRLIDHAAPAGDPQYYGAGIVNAFRSLTRGAGFAREPYVRLVNALTGETTQTVKASATGSFRIAHLPIGGTYRIFGGLDESGDGLIGTLGRSFGSYGGAAGRTVETNATEIYETPFAIGLPYESGSNSSSGSADVVPVGGYVTAQLGAGQEDWYAITLPAGTYTIGTAGVRGSCGMAAQANTRIDLFDPIGALVATSDDGSGFDYCARVTQTLSAGTYRARVRGSTSVPFGEATQANGDYRIYVRSGG